VASDTSKAIDELYSLPLQEFVARRDELARALRDEGEREEAAETKSLRKPSVAAWAVNQLARHEKAAVGELLDAGKRLRAAHEKLLSGGSAEALQRASEAERDALRRLTRAAERVLAEAGLSTTSGTLERVRETLHAAAVDEQVAELVGAGRVTTDEEATGFGLDLLAAARSGTATAPPTADEQRSEKRAHEARERLETAEARVRDARGAVKDAERTIKEHARALERAERELASHQKKLELAEREVETARARVSDA
jgi:hypothetical protein